MLLVKTYLAKSPISGMGCFAAEPIKKGDIIWSLLPGFDVVLTDEQFEALPAIAKEFTLHYCYYNKKEGGYILCSDNGKYFNHSIKPNCVDEGLNTTAGRDIAISEEITCNYYSFDEHAARKLAP